MVPFSLGESPHFSSEMHPGSTADLQLADGREGRFVVLDSANDLCVDLGLAAGVGAAISSWFVDSHMGSNIGGDLNQLVAKTP